ncbi:ADP-ribosylation factor-like protein 15 isoform X2 [Homo sapiens]|uniref:ADP-ribosylation factor-like protein 15 isoform X2 n=1 Tax=Homo sapiens TaxID=9606 RepID=UPI0005D023B2|nr:ADP-ribosylation factor-like protein 15 isoform X2 [Homo sapiens]XP_054208832.1 ADP-ribosylation factor-like protein 15 isoform X2 [Homo sapiens]|eukprot:XP_011541801.1 ADP-ribosylation factor-like protein 15 isoform X2 [Homo sapiens]
MSPLGSRRARWPPALRSSLFAFFLWDRMPLGFFLPQPAGKKNAPFIPSLTPDFAEWIRCFRALCCKGPPPARPEYDLVCIGLTGSGKTSLLSKLCSESPDNVVSTTGFSIKAVPFQNAILNVKELGGADNIRKYWSRYYQGSQGVIFVLDSASSEDDLEAARNELHSALQHPQLCTLPFLILANHQDKPAARSVQEIKKYFELEPLARGKRWILQPCSLDDMDALKDSFSQLINLLEEKDHEAVRM